MLRTPNNLLRHMPRINFYDYAPLHVFLIIYTITCLFGALFILLNNSTLIALYKQISGAKIPLFTPAQVATNYYLLLLAPLLLCMGYSLGIKIFTKKKSRNSLLVNSNATEKFLPFIANAIFYLLVIIGLITLKKAGSLDLLNSWFNYNDWVIARWVMFQQISFFGFVNIYTLIPLAAACILLVWSPKTYLGKLMRWIPIIIAIGINILTYQKKAALIVELIFFVSWYTYLYMTNMPRNKLKKLTIAAICLILASYYILLLPTFSPLPSSNEQNLLNSPNATKLHSDKKLNFLVNEEIKPRINYNKATYKVFSYSPYFTYLLLAPLTRTSVPALYYSVVFPSEHPFYGLDIGQDMFGLGHMPDDNIVIWRYMYPNTPGAITAPFQFVLFSQIGLLETLIIVFFTGILLGGFWKILQKNYIPQPWASLFSSMIIVLVLYLAIDSARNGFLSSYGVFWGMLFISSLWLLTNILQRLIVYLTKHS